MVLSSWGLANYRMTGMCHRHPRRSSYVFIIIYIIPVVPHQGGGGSFKNRTPIGEVGCCESRMAERSH